MMNAARLAELPQCDSAPDHQLVGRILGGEKLLYAILMRRYNQRLYRTVRAIVRQDHEAEDVVQQAYVVAYDKLHQFRADASFGTWVTRIAINEAYGRIRRANTRNARLELVHPEGDEAMNDSEHDPEHGVGRRQLAGVLEACIDGLPERLRVVFMLRAVEELDTAETAATLSLSEEAVRVRLHRARALMRERLAATVEASPDAFHFAGERCDRIVLGALEKLGI